MKNLPREKDFNILSSYGFYYVRRVEDDLYLSKQGTFLKYKSHEKAKERGLVYNNLKEAEQSLEDYLWRMILNTEENCEQTTSPKEVARMVDLSELGRALRIMQTV